MDKTSQVFDDHVKRIFGPDAAFTGESGTSERLGSAEIRVNGRLIGRGPNFQLALQNAQRTAAGQLQAV